MKSIWLMGGFGNVLFQILAFNILKHKKINVKFNKTLTERNFITKILKWSIHQELYGELIDKSQFTNNPSILNILPVLLGNISKILNIKFKKATFYNEVNQFHQPYSSNIFGYFQEIDFLTENKKELLKLCEDIRKRYGSKSNNIVVHYRKGDSGWAKKYLNYYTKVKEMIKSEDVKVIIVTDSLEDAKEFFSDLNNVEIVRSKDALEDFKILLSAKKLYCAPSTFSWWAAHSLDESSEVVMPKFFENHLGIYLDYNYTII